MKKMFRMIQQWRYRRLYRKLFFLYAKKSNYAAAAAAQAAAALYWLTGVKWDDGGESWGSRFII